VRVAAVGDVHAGRDTEGLVRPGFAGIAKRADVLLVAGDLTQHGRLDEGKVLAGELADLGLPTIAVLGNHDLHDNADDAIRSTLEDHGIRTIEGESIVVDVHGCRVGVAGVKGFGGGFAGACATEFGEPEMKAFIRHTKQVSSRLREELLRLDCDVRIALTHYSPIKDTLMGERLEIYPFLGSYLLSEAIDQAGCDLALHGHAHRGTEHGVTAGGVPVRNVARTVIRGAYKVYSVSRRRDGRAGLTDAAPPAPPEMRVPAAAVGGGVAG
jgi:Icc-related predicted phosphoesterase